MVSPFKNTLSVIYDMAARSSGWKAFTMRRATGNPLGLNRSPNPTKTDEWIGLGADSWGGREYFPHGGRVSSAGDRRSDSLLSAALLFAADEESLQIDF